MSTTTSLPGALSQTTINPSNPSQSIQRDFSFGSSRHLGSSIDFPDSTDSVTLGSGTDSSPIYRADQASNEDEGAIAQALGNDPKLLSQINYILQFLRKFSPALAKAFLKSLRAGMEGGNSGNAPTNSNVPSSQSRINRTSTSVAFSNLEIEISYSAKTEVSSSTDGKTLSKESIQKAQISIRFTSATTQSAKADPIVLDLDGNGIRASGLKDGQLFDINADGKMDLTSFILGGDGLLALDRNRNGKIDDGSELFGDQLGASNGFEELRKLDDNKDGIVNSKDRAFANLSLLTTIADRPGELQLTSLAQAGVAALRLAYHSEEESLNPDVSIVQKGSFVKADGTQGLAADLLLAFRNIQE